MSDDSIQYYQSRQAETNLKAELAATRRKLAEAEAREAALYVEVQGMRDSAEVFGLYSAEAAGLAFEGVLSAMTDMAKSPSEALTALLAAEREKAIEFVASYMEEHGLGFSARIRSLK